MIRARLILLIALLPVFSLVHAQTCKGISDDRVLAFWENFERAAMTISAASQRPFRDQPAIFGRISELKADQRRSLVNISCETFQQFPVFLQALEYTANWSAEPDNQDWLSEVMGVAEDSRSGYNCLSYQAYLNVRLALFGFQGADIATQFLCDSNGCNSGVCSIPCKISAATAIAITPFEAGLAVDSEKCFANHASRMSDSCDAALGSCESSRQSANNFVAIENLVSNGILPEASDLNDNVAQGDALRATQSLLLDRLSRTSSQLQALRDLIDQDALGQAGFKDDLTAMDIELALSARSGSAPVDLQIPAIYGGRLELVREVVADAIANSLQAGLEVGQALERLSEGNDHLNENAYQDAFEAFRSAYLELLP